MTDEKLKACPFCGSGKVKTFGPYGWYRQWGISHSCKSFYSGTCEIMQGFPSEKDAIAAWNARTPDPELSALRQRVKELEGALGEQIGECFDERCEMCARHEATLSKGASIDISPDTLHGNEP